MKIDMVELQKQRREEILNSNQYLRIEIIVPRVNELDMPIIPIMNVEQRAGSALTVLGTLNCLEEVKDSLIERHSEILKLKNFLGIKSKKINEKGEVYE